MIQPSFSIDLSQGCLHGPVVFAAEETHGVNAVLGPYEAARFRPGSGWARNRHGRSRVGLPSAWAIRALIVGVGSCSASARASSRGGDRSTKVALPGGQLTAYLEGLDTVGYRRGLAIYGGFFGVVVQAILERFAQVGLFGLKAVIQSGCRWLIQSASASSASFWYQSRCRRRRSWCQGSENRVDETRAGPGPAGFCDDHSQPC